MISSMWFIIVFAGLLWVSYYLGNKLGNKKMETDNFNKWIEISKDNPLPFGEEVLAYNKEWIDDDNCLNGVRIGFCTEGDDGPTFYSAKWNNDQDYYTTQYEEGDDYDSWQQVDKEIIRRFYHKDGEVIEGYLPNMPTHFMHILPPTINH